MRLKFISILASWLMFALAGIFPCSAVNVIPYPQSVEMTDVVFNKKKIDKVKYVTDKEMPSEAYELCIKKSGVVIKVSDDKGRFYALQTLKQLAEAEVMYCGVIKDEPRFPWRGFMLDESRHFHGKEKVKMLLDMMARYKLNRFHWHLSDDQGWRIEIKAFPNLTTVGGIGCNTDANAPAKFYTQDEVREILAYAAERHIEVIPEIDMPGHTTAFTKVFPQLNGKNRTVNPGKEETYAVLKTIYGELAELFPGRYIHTGGDEVNKNGWNDLPEVKALMEKENLKSLGEVEEFFCRRLADIVTATGKNVVAWDDLIDCGTKPDGKVMLWWHTEHPEFLQQGADRGFDMVVCPDRPFYLDFVQDKNDKVGHLVGRFTNYMQQIYEFGIMDNPRVIGVQSNLWSERVVTPKRIDYMVFPRLLALAEKGWTWARNLDYQGFLKRLENEYKYMDAKGIYYYDFRNKNNHPEPER